MLDGQNCHIQDSFFLIAKPKVTVDRSNGILYGRVLYKLHDSIPVGGLMVIIFTCLLIC